MSPKLSIIYPYYDNPGMLLLQEAHIRALPEAVRSEIEYVFVDDGSPTPISVGDIGAARQVFRIRRDIPWNQHGARNLGAHHARGTWLILTDMDHVVPADTLAACLAIRDPAVYTFRRSDHTGERIRPHVNSFLMPRARYWEIGGYDEDYRGLYGTDRLWIERLGPTVELASDLVVHTPQSVPDAATRSFSRKFGLRMKVRWWTRLLWKRVTGRGVHVLKEPYDRIE